VERDLLAADHRERWHRDGWCLLERFLPDDDVAAAQLGLAARYPRLDMTPWREAAGRGTADQADAGT
jgi:hypothetical protein